jgi:hypothetical protein
MGTWPLAYFRHEKVPGNWRWGIVWVVCGFLAVPLAFSREGMDQKTRIEVIRGMLREVAVTKVALPRGKRGVRVDAKGKLDREDALKEMRTNGAAMKSGMPAEITKIEFKEKQIVFELNGGGRSGKKWYQHIDISMGGMPEPLDQQDQVLAYGSSVTLDYGADLPDLTIPQIKTLLSNVLDFQRHSPTVLYSPNLPPAVKEAIKNHKVIVGMDRDAVLSAKGTPDRRVRDVQNGVEEEDWIYGIPPHVLFVTFEGDLVSSVKQY